MQAVFAALSALILAATATLGPARSAAPAPGPAIAAVAPARPTTLTVVAHQDDDILFINPDLSRDIAAGRRVVTVFLTAGDAGKSTAYWRGREAGAMAAYAQMAGVRNRWATGRARIAGHSLTRVTLAGRPISLVFLRLPDGRGYPQHNWETMRKLWTGGLGTIHAIDRSAAYTKASLTSTLTAVMAAYRPNIIRTLDFTGAYTDGDHSDHRSAAYFTQAAQRDYRLLHTVSAYQGYPAESRPANLTRRARDAKMDTFLAYARHDPHVCDTRAKCLANTYALRLARRYSPATELGGGRNAAPAAQVSASSQGSAAARAVDGTATGPYALGWTAQGTTGWIRLDWAVPQRLGRVVLYDRPGPDRVTAGVLTFSDGSTVRVGALPDTGSARVVTFPPRTVTSVRFTITGVAAGTRAAGLAEIQAYRSS